jgi:hypothetical protein
MSDTGSKFSCLKQSDQLSTKYGDHANSCVSSNWTRQLSVVKASKGTGFHLYFLLLPREETWPENINFQAVVCHSRENKSQSAGTDLLLPSPSHSLTSCHVCEGIMITLQESLTLTISKMTTSTHEKNMSWNTDDMKQSPVDADSRSVEKCNILYGNRVNNSTFALPHICLGSTS